MIRLNYKYFLKNCYLSIFVALFLGLIVAVCTSLVGIASGPLLKLFINYPPPDYISTNEILGEHGAKLLFWLNGVNSFDSNYLLKILPFLIIILVSFKAAATFFHNTIWEIVAEFNAANLRKEIINSYLKSSINQNNYKTIKDTEDALATHIATDTKIIKEYITRFYGGIPKEFVTVFLLAIIMILLSPKFFIIFFLGLLPIGAILAKLAKKIRGRVKQELDHYTDLVEWLQERFLGIENIKQLNTESVEINKLIFKSDELKKRYLKTTKVKARTPPIVEAFSVYAIAFVIFLIFSAIYYENIPGTVFISFFSCLALLSQSAKNLSRYFTHYNESSYACQRVETLINTLSSFIQAKDNRNYNKEMDPILSVKNISFNFSKSKNALSDFSFEFFPKKFYVICGKSGSGKTTLSKVLANIYTPSNGEINLNFDPNLNSNNNTSNFVYVPQSINLLATGVASNICFPLDSSFLDKSKLDRALKIVNLDIAILKDTDKIFKKDGSNTLSGGEAQRLLLARVFYHTPKLVIIDEGTSALDEPTENTILTNLKELCKKGMCVIMIAHRKSVLNFADEVILMHQGKMTFSGSSENSSNNSEFQTLFKANNYE